MTSWNAMLAGFAKAGELGLARRVFSEMPLRDEVSWSTMIVGFSHNGCFLGPFLLLFNLKGFGGIKC